MSPTRDALAHTTRLGRRVQRRRTLATHPGYARGAARHPPQGPRRLPRSDTTRRRHQTQELSRWSGNYRWGRLHKRPERVEGLDHRLRQLLQSVVRRDLACDVVAAQLRGMVKKASDRSKAGIAVRWSAPAFLRVATGLAPERPRRASGSGEGFLQPSGHRPGASAKRHGALPGLRANPRVPP